MDFNQQEKEWLAALKTGDKTAFRAIYNQYYKYLVVTAFNVLGDSDSARDLAQDVFVEIWKKKGKAPDFFLPESLPPAGGRQQNPSTISRPAGLISTTRPLCQKRSPITHGQDEKLHATNLEKIIHDAIASLPERCRIIFTLCRLEKLSHKEIAKQLDISTKTVENQMTRALAMLRKSLEPYVGEGLLLLICSVGAFGF